MTISLNHTIVYARDQETSAKFLTGILGLSPHTHFGHFAVVQVGETSLDFMETDSEIASQHYAFLVSESEFDRIFQRIKDRHLIYWADPARQEPRQINTRNGGRGFYFEDPNGHFLEILTRPYGSGVASNT